MEEDFIKVLQIYEISNERNNGISIISLAIRHRIASFEHCKIFQVLNIE